jgi:hypothetical protein
VELTAGYESWRYEDREVRKMEGFANSYKWAVPDGLKTRKDEIGFEDGGVLFVHRNQEPTVFDLTVKQQGMEAVKDQLFNPLRNLTFGGKMWGDNLMPAGNYEGKYLDTGYKGWLLKSNRQTKLRLRLFCPGNKQRPLRMENHCKYDCRCRKTEECSRKNAGNGGISSGTQFCGDRNTDSADWKVGRNYQLFRYMLP